MKRLNRRSFLATVAGGTLAGGFLAACTRQGGEGEESDAAPATNRGGNSSGGEDGGSEGTDSDAS